MKSNDKNLESFVDKLMKNDVLEKPSTDFTVQILKRLDIESKSITYTPLIPKWVWIIISLSFVSIAVYALLNHQDSGSKISEFLNLSQIELSPINFTSFNFSKILLYAMVVFTVMIGVQIPVLKTYLNRRMQF